MLLHALNAYLVYRLARALRLGPPTSLIAALLFVVFPFNYQVVPWAGAVFHPLVTALILLSLLTYRAARLHGATGWLVCSLICAALALFTHEYAVTLGVLIAGVELWLWREGDVPGWRPYALLYFGLAGGYLLWWAAVPKWPRAYTIDGVSLWRNALMFLQAACWPLTLGWRWAPASLLNHPELSVAALSALVLPLVTWLSWRAASAALARRRRALVGDHGVAGLGHPILGIPRRRRTPVLPARRGHRPRLGRARAGATAARLEATHRAGIARRDLRLGGRPESRFSRLAAGHVRGRHPPAAGCGGGQRQRPGNGYHPVRQPAGLEGAAEPAFPSAIPA